MSLVDSIIREVLLVASSGRRQISVCASHGVSCEGWLKTELLCRFEESLALSDGVEIFPEAQNVDLTIRSTSEEVLLELKTFPTNFGRSGKPITNFVDGVVKDLVKLSQKRASAGVGLAIWMAYVIPEQVPSTWPRHLARIEVAAARIRLAERIPLWDRAFANLYIMESK